MNMTIDTPYAPAVSDAIQLNRPEDVKGASDIQTRGFDSNAGRGNGGQQTQLSIPDLVAPEFRYEGIHQLFDVLGQISNSMRRALATAWHAQIDVIHANGMEAAKLTRQSGLTQGIMGAVGGAASLGFAGFGISRIGPTAGGKWSVDETKPSMLLTDGQSYKNVRRMQVEGEHGRQNDSVLYTQASNTDLKHPNKVNFNHAQREWVPKTNQPDGGQGQFVPGLQLKIDGADRKFEPVKVAGFKSGSDVGRSGTFYMEIDPRDPKIPGQPLSSDKVNLLVKNSSKEGGVDAYSVVTLDKRTVAKNTSDNAINIEPQRAEVLDWQGMMGVDGAHKALKDKQPAGVEGTAVYFGGQKGFDLPEMKHDVQFNTHNSVAIQTDQNKFSLTQKVKVDENFDGGASAAQNLTFDTQIGQAIPLSTKEMKTQRHNSPIFGGRRDMLDPNLSGANKKTYGIDVDGSGVPDRVSVEGSGSKKDYNETTAQIERYQSSQNWSQLGTAVLEIMRGSGGAISSIFEAEKIEVETEREIASQRTGELMQYRGDMSSTLAKVQQSLEAVNNAEVQALLV